MIFIKTICFIKDHKFPEWLQKKLSEVMQEQEGKRVLVTIETEKKNRSNEQNRFYYGVILPLIVSMFRDAGNTVSKDDVHEFLKLHVGKLVKDIHDPDGESLPISRSSADLTTKEWEDWLTNIRVWAAHFGVQVPLPNEIMHQDDPGEERWGTFNEEQTA